MAADEGAHKAAEFLIGLGKLAGAMITVLIAAALLGKPLVREIAKQESDAGIATLRPIIDKQMSEFQARALEDRREFLESIRKDGATQEKLLQSALLVGEKHRDRIEKQIDRIETQVNQVVMRVSGFEKPK